MVLLGTGHASLEICGAHFGNYWNRGWHFNESSRNGLIVQDIIQW